MPLLTQLVATLAAAGFISWLLLEALDVVVGWIRRTSPNAPKPGSWSWAYAFAFVRTTLAWKDAVIMAGAVGLAFLATVGAYVSKLAGGDLIQFVLVFKLAALAALATFSATAAKQNIALIADIQAKLLDKSAQAAATPAAVVKA